MATGFVFDLRPEIFSFMPLPRWYSLLFATGIVLSYALMRGIFRREGRTPYQLDSLLAHVIAGMMIGMRLGHVIFYQPRYFLAHPLEILMIWRGGYASHGGFFGVLIAMVLFTRRHRDIPFFWLGDRVAIISMLTAGFIRIGNFFNSEMIGRPAPDLPWAVTFALIDGVPRHPSQLYEALGYFAIAAGAHWAYRDGRILRMPGRLLGAVVIAGFTWRFVCEFFKENQVEFEQGLALNMGQLLSLPFIIFGFVLVVGMLPRQSARSARN